MKRTYVATVADRELAEDRSYMTVRFVSLLHARETKETVELRGPNCTEIITPKMATDEELTVVRDVANRETNGRALNAVGAVAMVGRVN